jgi:galactoside O-acetyltransferase
MSQKNCEQTHYSREELESILGKVGTEVKVHRSVVFFNPKNIFLASHVRIDCFCLLSGGSQGIRIGNYTHLGAATHLFGGGGEILIEDFSNVSSRVSLFTSNDDYIDGTMTNPWISKQFKKLSEGSIKLGKHAIIGCGSIILPDIEIGLGASIGALSLVNRNVEECAVVAGIPIRKIRMRDTQFLELEKEFTKKSLINS